MSVSGPGLPGPEPGPQPQDLATSLRRIVEAPWPRDDAESMPGMATVLAAAIDQGADSDLTAAAGEIALRFGGQPVDGPAEIPILGEADPARLVSAAFHSVCDATRASLEIASLVVAAGADADNPLAALRVVLCTAADAPEGPHGGRALDKARSLLGKAAAGQILATAPTAVVAGPTLPAGIVLLDRGLWTPLADGQPERVYEMRVGGAPLDVASNLEWARRALHDPSGTVVADVDRALRTAVTGWAPARAGSARVVLLHGGTAADRTAVAAELALTLHAEGAHVLYGRWTPTVHDTNRAFREALGFHAAASATEQLMADLQGWADEIGHLLPEVGARVGGAVAARVGSTFERAGMFDAVGHWVQTIAGRVPTVFVLDDADRADPTSMSLLSHLWHSCRSSALLLLITAADVAVADRIADLVGHPEPAAVVRVAL